MILHKQPKWFGRFINLVESCWEHHGPCLSLHRQCKLDTEKGEWLVTVAPVFQEVLGGESDGEKVWTGFIFHSDIFYQSDGVFIEHFAASSLCNQCSPHPRLIFRGKYRGHKIYLQVFLEPPGDTEIVEIIDTVKSEVRLK